MNASELTKQITARIETLAQATDAAIQSETMRTYLETCARFHTYSPNNVWLILFNMPTASHVAGFNAWHKFNRFVRKGEHGIPILAPCPYKSDEGENKIWFKVTYVFDISQTDGEPLPPPPDWKSPGHLYLIDQGLLEFAQTKGIAVKIENCGSAQGVSKGGEIILDPTAGTKTLIHELAHELLHKGDDNHLDHTTKEIEAEATAYAVAAHFGLPDLASPNYIALCGGAAQDITARLHRIIKTASEIINAIEPQEASNHDSKM
jgi:hypothetical protein